MKSLICSDIHDHIKNLETALNIAQTSNCDSVICCGDLCSPFVIDIFNKHSTIPIHIIFGNNDGDQFNILNKCNLINKTRPTDSLIYTYGQFYIKKKNNIMQGVPDEVALAVYHYPEPAKSIFNSKEFDYVFYGHTHKPELIVKNGRLLANPGSLMGYVPSGDGLHVTPTCLIIDWQKRENDLIEL